MGNFTKSILLYITVILLTSCNQGVKKGEYSVTGNVKGINNGWVKFLKPNYINREKLVIIDSTKIVDGKFKLNGKVKYADDVIIILDSPHNDEYYAEFILHNAPIKLTLDVSKVKNSRSKRAPIKIEGSDLNDLLNKQNKLESDLLNQSKYSALNKKSSNKSAEDIKSQKQLTDERNNELIQSKLDFIKTHPSSPVAPYVYSFQFAEDRMTVDEMKKVYNIFKGAATHTAMFEYYTKTYNDITKRLAKGSTVPDFTLPTYNGDSITLSKIKAQYVLIDFWASWCHPCRQAMKYFKVLYKKYHKDGFEIISIGTADSGIACKKAIKEDGLPWLHVFDGNPNSNKRVDYGVVSKIYGVPFLPTTFLINKNRVIIGRQLKEETLASKLKELYGH